MLAYLAYKQGKKQFAAYQERHYYDEYNRPCQNPLDPNAPRRLPPPFATTTTVEKEITPSGKEIVTVTTEEKALVPARAAISAPVSRQQSPAPAESQLVLRGPPVPQRIVTTTTTETTTRQPAKASGKPQPRPNTTITQETTSQPATASGKPVPPPKPVALRAPPRPKKPAALSSAAVTPDAGPGLERRSTFPLIQSPERTTTASPVLPPRRQLLLADSASSPTASSRMSSPDPALPPRSKMQEVQSEEIEGLSIKRSQTIGHAVEKPRVDPRMMGLSAKKFTPKPGAQSPALRKGLSAQGIMR